MRDLIDKERERIKRQKQEIINQGAIEGKTIPLAPILEILNKLRASHQGNEVFVAWIDHRKKELIEKYGTDIPVGEAYRLMTEYEDEHGPL